MNKKQKEELKYILDLLNQGIENLQNDKLFICLSGDITAMKEDKYFNYKNEQLTPFNKFCGSKRNYLVVARDSLNKMVEVLK